MVLLLPALAPASSTNLPTPSVSAVTVSTNNVLKHPTAIELIAANPLLATTTSVASVSAILTAHTNATGTAVHGLGTAAQSNSTAFATAPQGAKADTALQPSWALTGTVANAGAATTASTAATVTGPQSNQIAQTSAHTNLTGTAVHGLGTAATYTVGESVGQIRASKAPVALTYAGTNITTDASLGCEFTLTLTNNATLATPSNVASGQPLMWWIKQGRGTNTLAVSSGFLLPSGSTNITLSTAINSEDCVTGRYRAGINKVKLLGNLLFAQ